MLPKDVKLVTQPDKFGCVIACISMVTGKPYKKVSGKYISHDLNRQGYNTTCQNKILNDLGYKTCVIKDFPTKRNSMCILTVKSLNYDDGSQHAIVYLIDARGYLTVLDPNCGFDHKKFDEDHPRKYYTLADVLALKGKPGGLVDCTIVWKDPNFTGTHMSEKDIKIACNFKAGGCLVKGGGDVIDLTDGDDGCYYITGENDDTLCMLYGDEY